MIRILPLAIAIALLTACASPRSTPIDPPDCIDVDPKDLDGGIGGTGHVQCKPEDAEQD